MKIALIVLAVIVYVRTEIDIIPDFILTLGWADDGGVIGLALSAIGRLMLPPEPSMGFEEPANTKT